MNTRVQVHIISEDYEEMSIVVMPCCPRIGELIWLVDRDGSDYGEPEAGEYMGIEVKKLWHLATHEIDLPLDAKAEPYHRVVVEGRALTIDDAPMPPSA
jgi:hypothetical protein